MLLRALSNSRLLSTASMIFALTMCCRESLGGHPYVDRHFHLDSTPRYGNYGSGMDGNYGDQATHSATCSNGTCGRAGISGAGNCPPVQNAILRLWVPDDATVEINGYPTRPQLLGGIHRGSRVYSLEGLDTDRVSPCEIVVCFGDSMNQRKFYREIPVHAGGHYQVRFPDEFEQISAEMTLPEFNQFSEGATVEIPTPPLQQVSESYSAPQAPLAPEAAPALTPVAQPNSIP